MVKKFRNKERAKKPFKKSQKETPEDDNIEDEDGDFQISHTADFYVDDGDAIDDEGEASQKGDLDGSELDFDEEVYISSEEDEEPEEKKHKLTKEELKKYFKKCNNGTSFAITKIISIFSKVANQKVDSLDEDNILNKPIIVKKILSFAIKNLPEILLLKYNSIEYDKTKESKANIKNTIHRYLSVLGKFLKNAEKGTINFLFKYIENISNLIVLFKNLIEIYLKITIKIWAINNSNRKNALKLIKFILYKKPEYFDLTLKLFYINYLEIAKATNWSSVGKIKDLQSDIISILSLDYQRAYITIFSFIRKLCLQLRMTVNDKKANSIKNIYNWQFINSINLWSRVVCEYFNKKNCEINLLAYPLIQTILGVIRLNLVDTFYPLRLYLLKILNQISMTSGIYIPIANYIIEIIESTHFTKYYKEKVNESRLDFNINLKVKKEEFKHYNLIQSLLEESLDILMEFLAINSYKYSFPDISHVVIFNLKKVQKNMMEKSFKEMIKKMLEKIQVNSDFVENKRGAVNLLQKEELSKFEGSYF
jgi:nucleolar complex protein 2